MSKKGLDLHKYINGHGQWSFTFRKKYVWFISYLCCLFLTVYHHMGSTILITRVTCARTRDSRPTLECLWGLAASKASSRMSEGSGLRPRTGRWGSASQTWVLRSTSSTSGWTGTGPRRPDIRVAILWISEIRAGQDIGQRPGLTWSGRADSGALSPCPRWTPTLPARPSPCRCLCGNIWKEKC